MAALGQLIAHLVNSAYVTPVPMNHGFAGRTRGHSHQPFRRLRQGWVSATPASNHSTFSDGESVTGELMMEFSRAHRMRIGVLKLLPPSVE